MHFRLTVHEVNAGGEGPRFYPGWYTFLLQLIMIPGIIVLQLVLNGPVVTVAFLNNRADYVRRLELQERPNCCVACCRGVGTFFVGVISLFYGFFGAPLFTIIAFLKYLINFIWY